MGGYSGSSAIATLPDYMKDSHGLIIQGMTSGFKSWDKTDETGEPFSDTGTFGANPSVLRYILQEGQTAAGGNPYDGVTAYNPDGKLAEVEDSYAAFSSLLEEYLSSKWDENISTALSKAPLVIEDIDIASLVDTLVSSVLSKASQAALAIASDAETILTSYLPQAHQRAVSQSKEIYDRVAEDAQFEYDNIPTDIQDAKLDAEGVVDTYADILSGASDDTDVETGRVRTKAITDSDSALEAAALKSNLLTSKFPSAGIESLSQAQQVSESAHIAAKTTMLELLKSIDPDVGKSFAVAISDVKGTLTSLLYDSLSVAKSAVDDANIAAMVKSYRQRALSTFLKNVNSFHGGMSDLNAVQSSQFIVGDAILHAEFTRDIDDYQAKLEMEIFTRLQQTFMESFSNLVAAYLDSYEKRFEGHLRTYGETLPNFMGVFMGVFPQYAQALLATMTEHTRLYSAQVTDGSDILRTSLGSRLEYNKLITDTVLAGVNSRLQLQGEKLAHLKELINVRMGAYDRNLAVDAGTFATALSSNSSVLGGMLESYITSAIKEKLDAREMRANFVAQGAGELDQIDFRRLDTTHNAIRTLAEITRIAIVAKREEEDTNMEYDVKNIHWDMELFQQGANIIGATTGSVVPQAGKPSKTASVLGGALAIGSALAGPLAPIAGPIAGGLLSAGMRAFDINPM